MTVAAASPSPLATFRIIAADIKLAHSVFALPFAILAAVMAAAPPIGFFDKFLSPSAAPAPVDLAMRSNLLGKLGLVVVAMVFARTAAMLSNRLLDARIDRRNPRTAGRALPSGRLTGRTASLALAFSAFAFIGVCSEFGWLYGNWWPLWLSLPVLAWICAYGLLKRFTSLCHLYLGSSLALSPIAAAIAIDPDAITLGPSSSSLWLLSGMVLCWVAGFDIIYALQDVDVDREQGLHSMPSRLGMGAAMQVSRVLHVAAVGCLVACWRLDPRLGWPFGIGVAVVAALLIYEHLTVARWGTTKIALAFFTLNGAISCLLGALGVIDVLWV